MLGRSAGFLIKRQPCFRTFSTVNSNGEWALFPRENEGNNYNVNYSLVEDGVTSVGDAFRNARLPILINAIGGKVQNSMIEKASPSYFGDYAVAEAGDAITHDIFADRFEVVSDHLSANRTLFVEDAGLGAHSQTRLGTRVTTDNAAVALIMRKLMIPVPSREVNHRSRFKGWNLDPRWAGKERDWKGDHYVYRDTSTAPAPAQRSILTFVTDKIEEVAVQFVEKNKEIVGANILAGKGVPVRGLIEAMGHAATVLVNEANENAIALPSLAVTKDASTVVIVGADDALVAAVAKGGLSHTLFGAYHNILSADGVSPMWNGYIGTHVTDVHGDDVPAVKVDGHSAHAIIPNNLAFSATKLIFFEKSATKGKVTVDEAAKRLVAVTDESKELLAKSLVKNIDLHVAGSVEDVLALLK